MDRRVLRLANHAFPLDLRSLQDFGGLSSLAHSNLSLQLSIHQVQVALIAHCHSG